LPGVPASFFFGDGGLPDNSDTRRRFLLLAFAFAALDVDIDVVRVSPLLLKGTLLLPESALVKPFAIGQILDEIRVHAAANSFDLGLAEL
jgi:hypothetical protein